MGRKKTWKEQYDWVFDYGARRSSKTKWIGAQERADKGGVKGFFACYLLTSLSPRHKGHTYIGFTVNPRRRIRQHNGEIGSGAATTKKKRPWEMVMCIYGFPNNVSALQFEWAWQHPRESLAVSQAAASFKSLSGLSNKIKLAFTMLTLSKWQNLDLTVNFFSSKYTKHTAGCATLPEHVIVQICSMDELPCYTGIYNTHEDVCEDEDRDDLDDNDRMSIKDTSTTEGLSNITAESDLYYESIDGTIRHSRIDDSFNWTKYLDDLDCNDLVDKMNIKDSSTTEGVANITTESDMYNYKSIDETISYSGVDDSYNGTEDAGLFHWGIEDYGSEDDLTGSEDLRNSIEDSGQLDNKRIEETISCIRIDHSLNRIEDVGVFDLGIEKNNREADLTRSDDLRNSIGENMSELDHHPNEEMAAKRGVCTDELAANSPNICHEVEVIDLLSPSPGYKVGLKSKRRKVSRGVIDLTRSPIFVEA